MTTSGAVTGPDRRPVTETTRRGGSRGGTEFGTALSAELDRGSEVATDAALQKAAQKQATQDRFAQHQATRYQSAQSQAAQDRRAQQQATESAQREGLAERDQAVAQSREVRARSDFAKVSQERTGVQRAAYQRSRPAADDRPDRPESEVRAEQAAVQAPVAARLSDPVPDTSATTGISASDSGRVVGGTGAAGTVGPAAGSGPGGVSAAGNTAAADPGSAAGKVGPAPLIVGGSGSEGTGGTAPEAASAATPPVSIGMPGTPGTVTAARPVGTQGTAGQQAATPETIAVGAGVDGTMNTAGATGPAPALAAAGAGASGPSAGAARAPGVAGETTAPTSVDPQRAGADRTSVTLSGDPTPAPLVGGATTAADPADAVTPVAVPPVAVPPVAVPPVATGQSRSGDSNQSSAGDGRPGTMSPAETPRDPSAGPAAVFGGVPQSPAVAGPAPAGPAPAPLPLPGPPATQLAIRIAPLRLDADGVHRLTVHLHPADLGPVQVIAEIRNGEINVQLSGATDAGNDALRNALDDLRRELERSGFSNTTLDLRQGPGQQDQARQQFGFLASGGDGTGTGTGGLGTEPADEPAATQPTGPDQDGRLDIKA